MPLPATVRSAARFITSCLKSRCCSSISFSSFSSCSFSYSASIRGLSACVFLHGTPSGATAPQCYSQRSLHSLADADPATRPLLM